MIRRRIAVFGTKGWLGELLASHLRDQPWVRSVDPINIRFRYVDEIKSALSAFAPDILINCAGRAGGPWGENIDYCEEWKDETWDANVTGPMTLKNLCDYYKVKLVHFGSGCIFENGGYLSETARPTPNSFYGETKALCDDILMKSPGIPPLILRLRMPIHKYPNPRNIIDKVLKYDKVLDVPNSMTYVPTLLEATSHLIQQKAEGIFNVVNPGTHSAWDIVKLYKEMYPELTLDKVSSVSMKELEELKKIKTGRSNCTLNIHKLKSTGYHPKELDLRELREIVEFHGKNFGFVEDGIKYYHTPGGKHE